MIISSTELSTNVSRYLDHAASEVVHVTRNGKIIATISGTTLDKQAILDGLVGIAATNPITLEQARIERLAGQ